jgi:dihydroorotate dehydrogenase (NAD+) catalytic subunit
VPLITNVMGSSAEEFSKLVEACEAQTQIAALELNVSCPNVATGLDIGASPATLEEVVRATRARTGKPLIVKLTPNAADVVACAQAAEAGGADAVSLINTLRAMARAPGRRARPWLGGGTGGLSGPAVRVVALAQVAAVAAAVGIPVVGMGGVQNAAHARALIGVGATLVAVGTENFCDPLAGVRIAGELGETAPASQSRACAKSPAQGARAPTESQTDPNLRGNPAQTGSWQGPAGSISLDLRSRCR